jgi:hypothetical protein
MKGNKDPYLSRASFFLFGEHKNMNAKKVPKRMSLLPDWRFLGVFWNTLGAPSCLVILKISPQHFQSASGDPDLLQS